MPFTASVWKKLAPLKRYNADHITNVEDCSFPSERSSTEEIPKEGQHDKNRLSDALLYSKRYQNEKIGTQRRVEDCSFPSKGSSTEEIPKEGQHNLNRVENCSFPSERSSTEEISKEGQHNKNRFADCSFSSKRSLNEEILKEEHCNQDRVLNHLILSRNYSTDIGTQRRVLDDLIHGRNCRMDMGTQRPISDGLLYSKPYQNEQIGTWRRVLNHLLWSNRNYSMDIGIQGCVLDHLLWSSRNYSMDIGTQGCFADCSFSYERSLTEEVLKEEQRNQDRGLDHLLCLSRNYSMDIGTQRRVLDHLLWLSRNYSMDIGTHRRVLDHLLWLSRNYRMDIGTQRRVLDRLLCLSRNYRMDIGTQRRILDHLLWLSGNYGMDIGTQRRISDGFLFSRPYQNEQIDTWRRVLDHLLWLSGNYSMDIGTQSCVLDDFFGLSRNYSMDIGTQRRPFLIFLGGPWTEEKLKKELHNQDVDFGTQNTKSCLPSLPSGEQSTEVLNEEKRHNEDEDCPIQNQHEDYGPNSAEVITQDNTKPEVKTELAETSGRGHNDITTFLCHLYNGVGEAAKNLMNISFIFTLYLMSITIVQPIHSLHIGMANQTIHFGEDVILECSFQQKENNQSLLMQWYKGNSDRLTQGRTSSNDEKYRVDLIQSGILNRYILTIRNLSVEDFDTYTCQHNFESTSFALYPGKSLFVYIPAEKEITASVNDDRGLKNVTFSIGLVYPKPSCSVSSKFEMENLQTKDEVELSTDSHLYRIKIALNVMMPVKRCADVIDLICEASGFPFNKTVRIDGTGCQDDIENDDGSFNFSIFLSVFIVVVMAVIGILVFICCIKTSKHGRAVKKERCATDEHEKCLHIT